MNNKKVLIIGSIGRDHAIGWKLIQSPHIDKIYFSPGNAGTEEIGESTGIPLLDLEAQIAFAKKHKIDLTFTSQDDVLAAGAVNLFQRHNIKIFGSSKEAAQIEASKAFAKQLMKEAKIPTASFAKFTVAKEAKAYLETQSFPIVIKASGLALGKGVIIAQTPEEAQQAITNIMEEKIFGEAGNEVVIEEFLQGYEVSVHAFCDGDTALLFPISKDHKTIFEDNQGPNTGGMGTIAPVPGYDEKFLEEVKRTIILPLLKVLKQKGITYKGVLYPGLMITKDGPKVLEFNARFGDPETQSYMRILDSDLFEIMQACVDGTLSEQKITWSEQFACCIVLASKGYPESSQKGVPIEGLDKKLKDVVVFHAGTKTVQKKIVTNGGRVLNITATANTLEQALQKAYTAIGANGVHFDGMQYRKDIGKIKA
jgi:phosphoribosylamine--glycine ligase